MQSLFSRFAFRSLALLTAALFSFGVTSCGDDDDDVAPTTPTISAIAPVSGVAGTVVTITGTNLTGATAVAFAGVAAPGYTVNSTGTTLTVTVPEGAKAGTIAVTTPSGTGTSGTSFAILANHLTLHFEHRGADGNLLELNRSYTNAAGNGYRLTTVKYYVSNVQLKKADGTSWTEANSYHLLNLATAAAPEVAMEGVLLGDYKTLTFSIGVDSAANYTLDNVGDLDTNADMFWSWATGYKFLKLEGTQANGTSIVLHTGKARTYRTVTLALPNDGATVRDNIAPEIHLLVDVNRIFGTAGAAIDLGGTGFVHMGDDATAVRASNNFAQSFSIEHVHNDAH